MKKTIAALKVTLLACFMTFALLPSGAVAAEIVGFGCSRGGDNCTISVNGTTVWTGNLDYIIIAL